MTASVAPRPVGGKELLLISIILSIACGQLLQPVEDQSKFCKGCAITDTFCECNLTIEHRLTMLHEKERELLKPSGGKLLFRNGTTLGDADSKDVITADGETSRLVITVNRQFPGPRIVAYDGQELRINIVNLLHTDSVSVHFHGMHQKGTPWMDGVAFVSQCPILPGQRFQHKFKAAPPGTSFYHAHIGDQRSMGLYGPLIIRNVSRRHVRDEIIVTLQDWNHDMDAETAYHRMVTEQFNLDTREPINTTYSVDGGKFSRFVFQSGLVNGKGRYYTSQTAHNGAPLERFKVRLRQVYRFRVIGAATLYPMRVYIEGQPITLLASDGFDVDEISVQSIIVHPGERFDFRWTAPGPSQVTKKEFLLVAESIETDESLRNAKLNYHAAEAVLEFEDVDLPISANPSNSRFEDCTSTSKCVVFNCPYLYYPSEENKVCKTFNEAKNDDDSRDETTVLGTPAKTLFLNFAFPRSSTGETPGSVNGKSFIPPTVPMQTQPGGVTDCSTVKECDNNAVCSCTYTESIEKDQLVQMVFMNVGNGMGWSHPVHLHGHSFYLMKIGFGSYDNVTGRFLEQTKDISCSENDSCIGVTWQNQAWINGNIPGLNQEPPEKDTVIVPTGGYVIIRFIADNPGMWFLHCHIDLHNTNGMGMVINEASAQQPKAPENTPFCGSYTAADMRKIFDDRASCGSYFGPLTWLLISVMPLQLFN